MLFPVFAPPVRLLRCRTGARGVHAILPRILRPSSAHSSPAILTEGVFRHVYIVLLSTFPGLTWDAELLLSPDMLSAVIFISNSFRTNGLSHTGDLFGHLTQVGMLRATARDIDVSRTTSASAMTREGKFAIHEETETRRNQNHHS